MSHISYDKVYDHHANLNNDPDWWIEDVLSMVEGSAVTREDVELLYDEVGSEPNGFWHLLDASTGQVIDRDGWSSWLVENSVSSFDDACDSLMFDLVLSKTGQPISEADVYHFMAGLHTT